MENLFRQLNIMPRNLELYKIAFSHSSYVNEHNRKNDYERLEFLGDAVLQLVISDYLYSKNHFAEGDMTKIRASYVCENALFAYATDLSLADYIKVGHGEELTGGKHKKAILADIFEALMGAIYLDLGFEKSKTVILNVIVPYIENPEVIFFSDYKSTLQEAVQTGQKSLSYELVNEAGPSHNREFTVVVKIDGLVYGKGRAKSKKEAEQEAAKKTLELLAIDPR